MTKEKTHANDGIGNDEKDKEFTAVKREISYPSSCLRQRERGPKKKRAERNEELKKYKDEREKMKEVLIARY